MQVCKSPTLKIDSAGDFFEKGDWMICGYVLRDYFDIPEEARKVQFFGYDKPAKNRVHVSLVDYCVRVDGDITFFAHDTWDLINALIEKHGTLYVECEYE